MKKILAVALTLMLIPFSAFGLEMLEDSTLDDVTGQAGVSIATDVSMDVDFDVIAWGDSDGIDADGNDSAGWVGLTGVDMNGIRIKLRDDLVPTPADIQLFTIDVATNASGDTYVHLLLGTQQITMTDFTATAALGESIANPNYVAAADADGNGVDMYGNPEYIPEMQETLGTMYMSNFMLLMDKDSYVDIYAHGDSGVTLTFGVDIAGITFDAASWGDTDGINDRVIAGMTADLGDYTLPGYVGLAKAGINDLTTTGSLLIDVATINPTTIDPNNNSIWNPTGGVDPAGAYLLGVYYNMLNAASYDGSETAVLLQFTGLTVHMDSFTADVVVAADSAFTTGASTMGSVYASGMDVTLNGWVGIFAH